MTDPRPAFLASLDNVGGIIAATPREAYPDPTPCDEFDVRALLGHLVGVAPRMAHVLGGGSLADAPGDVAVDGDHQAQWAEQEAKLRTLIADDALLERNVTPPFGERSGAEALTMYECELATHAWDLAAAIGRSDLLDDAIAARLLPIEKQMLPDGLRGGPVPFAEVVATTADASPYEQLVAWTGRDPSWSR